LYAAFLRAGALCMHAQSRAKLAVLPYVQASNQRSNEKTTCGFWVVTGLATCDRHGSQAATLRDVQPTVRSSSVE
jgi:hypothetical protein